ncbi:hypothetical protein AB1046_10710 [Promicromonospora sp. Populi]|uniref:hypothetical protein n=1 Tax=Promicromonospora sp. Populi TaxID=3239420 RepID=UPI0034E25596
MRRSAAVVIAAAALTGLVAPTASAAPGDPAPGWPNERYDVMYRDVDVSGSGRVFAVGLPDPDILDYSFLEHGVGADWSSVEVPVRSEGGVVAGPDDYAVAVTGNVSRVFNGSSWGGPVQIAAAIGESKLVGNTNGDAALLWTAPGGGTPQLSRLIRGGTWQTVPLANDLAGALADVVINDAGKVTVVWADRTGATSQIGRVVLQKGSSTWASAGDLGSVNNTRPKISIVTDGQGRETVIAGNKLWRQTTSTTLPRYQFRTSTRAVLATGTTGTRLIWAVKTSGRYEIRTRFADPQWRAEKLLWWHDAPTDPSCDKGIQFGVGMVPGGRSYVAVGIRHDIDDINLVCEGVEIADILTVDRADGVLNQRHLSDYSNGGPFQVDASSRGPVVVTYEYEDDGDGVGGEPPADGFWYMRFYSR